MIDMKVVRLLALRVEPSDEIILHLGAFVARNPVPRDYIDRTAGVNPSLFMGF